MILRARDLWRPMFDAGSALLHFVALAVGTDLPDSQRQSGHHKSFHCCSLPLFDKELSDLKFDRPYKVHCVLSLDQHGKGNTVPPPPPYASLGLQAGGLAGSWIS